MADRDTTSRIAKILARATSDNQNEADASLKSAYARMKRDGVSVRDLLELPTQELYQDALVRLIDIIVQDQTDLSPSSRRDLYASYLQLVVMRFSGAAGEKEKGREPPRPGPEQARPKPPPRQEQKRPEPPPRQEPPRQEQRRPEPPPRRDEKEYKRENVNTPKQSEGRQVDVTAPAFSFSPAVFFSFLGSVFGRGSFISCALHAPGRAFQLLAISAIFGAAASGGLLLLVALVLSWGEFEPFGNVRLVKVFLSLAVIGTAWKGSAMHRNGWFSYY